MKIELYKLYQYVFDDWSDIYKHVKSDLDTTAKDNIYNKKKNEIKHFFNGLIKHEDSPLFRAALRTLNSTHLEQILFGNSTDELKENYTFPDDKFIEDLFKQNDKIYGYFSEIKQGSTEYNQFKKIFNICKLVGDIIEKNNDPTNTVAALHAYKIFVVFGNFANFEKYLSSFNCYKSDHPIHDALIYEIPKNTKSIKLASWQNIILKSGPRAFQLFNLAAMIATKLNRQPTTYTEALTTAKKISYKNADQYPQLADICFEYHVDEKIFETCLGIDKMRKDNDNLPNIIVNGADIEKPGYYLTKLPANDPRAYLLGYITNCCQSIGNNSEACVIDGITRKNNGFYVLLKEKKSSDNKSTTTRLLDDNGNINYKKFDIVGQGYAWITEQGNLTFDSWENLTPSRDDKIIVPILTKFSQQVVQSHTNILRVTIGTGGKTPNTLTHLQTYPETILEGTQYGDADNQSMIYCDEARRNQITKQLINDLDTTLNFILSQSEHKGSSHASIKENIYKWITEACYSETYAKKIKSMFEAKETQAWLRLLISKDQWPPRAPNWSILFKLYDAKLLTVSLWNKLNASVSHYIMNQSIKGILALTENKLENDLELVNFIFDHPEVCENYTNAFIMLRKANLDKEPMVRTYLFKNAWYIATDIATTFIEIYRLKLQNEPEFIEAIASDSLGEESTHIYMTLLPRLKEINMEKDIEVRNAMIKMPHAAENILTAFNELTKFNLQNDKSMRKIILTDPYETHHLVAIISNLNKLKLTNEQDALKFIRDMNISPILKANTIESLCQLNEAAIKDSEIRTAIFDQPKTAKVVIAAFSRLAEENIPINENIKKTILSNPGYATKAAQQIIQAPRISSVSKLFSEPKTQFEIESPHAGTKKKGVK